MAIEKGNKMGKKEGIKKRNGKRTDKTMGRLTSLIET